MRAIVATSAPSWPHKSIGMMESDDGAVWRWLAPPTIDWGDSDVAGPHRKLTLEIELPDTDIPEQTFLSAAAGMRELR